MHKYYKHFVISKIYKPEKKSLSTIDIEAGKVKDGILYIEMVRDRILTPKESQRCATASYKWGSDPSKHTKKKEKRVRYIL